MPLSRGRSALVLGAVAAVLAAAVLLRGCSKGTPGAAARAGKTAAPRGPARLPANAAPLPDPAAACWKPPAAPFTREELLARTRCLPPFGIRVAAFDYTPSISSAPGLAMSPQVPSIAPAGLTFRWQTDFGSFVRWAAPGFKVEPLGADTTNKGAEVYWTYDPGLGRAAKPEVHITLSAIDRSGKTLATAGQLLTWEWDMAVVKR